MDAQEVKLAISTYLDTVETEVESIVRVVHELLCAEPGDPECAKSGALCAALNRWKRLREEHLEPITNCIIVEDKDAAFDEHNNKVRARLKALSEK